MGGTVRIITGTPFTDAVFNSGTSSFEIDGDFTNMFSPGAYIVVYGTSTSNDGYYQAVSSVFNSVTTEVTVISYDVDTSHPGTVPFVNSGTGTVVWLQFGPPPVGSTLEFLAGQISSPTTVYGLSTASNPIQVGTYTSGSLNGYTNVAIITFGMFSWSYQVRVYTDIDPGENLFSTFVLIDSFSSSPTGVLTTSDYLGGGSSWVNGGPGNSFREWYWGGNVQVWYTAPPDNGYTAYFDIVP